jgi:hypothetical protein
MATYNLINEILEALNNKRKVVGIFFDLEKAFDCVNHNILLSKLEFYGITDNIYNLSKSYLENRYQRVILNDVLIIMLLLIGVLLSMVYRKDQS